MIFTLRHGRHVGGRKQKISHYLLLFVHQQLYIAALLSVSLEIGCKPPIGGRKQKISHYLLLFVRQRLYIAALVSVSLEIACKPPTVCIISHSNCLMSIAACKLETASFTLITFDSVSHGILYYKMHACGI